MKRTLIKNIEPNTKVKIQGYIKSCRSLSKITFLHIRERSGVTQVILNESKSFNIESVVEIVGNVVINNSSQFNNMEIVCESYKIISEGISELPVTINKKEEVPFNTILKYNPLTIRMEKRRNIFKIQSEFLKYFREFFNKEEFTEINSTKLVKGGLEGGGEMFEVKYYQEKAFLSQSPQLYKQMMVGPFERVYEVGKVYRAEGSNSNRHLSEYVGLDFEMGFIESYKEIVEMEEKMLNFIYSNLSISCEKELLELNVELSIPGSIPKISYEKAIGIVNGEFENGLTNEEELKLGEYSKKEFGSEFIFIMGYPKSKRPFYTMTNGNMTESFELLYKGMEVTSGSQRIHNYESLLNRMKELEMSTNGFEEYLLSFEVGLPPHGGCGIGLERMIKQMLNLPNVREASLFPKTKGHF